MNTVNSLAHQHFVHGSNVFLTVRSIGGGKEDIQTKTSSHLLHGKNNNINCAA